MFTDGRYSMILGVFWVFLCLLLAPSVYGVTWTVTNSADSGAGTLRWCMENAVNADSITFDPAIFLPISPESIAVTRPLPPLVQGNVTLDASNVGVILNGHGTPLGTSGLEVSSDGNTIKGMQILYFPETGIRVDGNHNTIGGNRMIGAGPSGEGNVVSACKGWAGIAIQGSDNIVSGNLIGTDITGTVALGNADGINIFSGQRNLIGGITAGRGNIVSGNGSHGIHIYGTMNNIIIGNFIGTDISGKKALGNQGEGVWVGAGASYNRIGGSNPGERNIISANKGGVTVILEGTTGNVILGNYIGTDASGMLGLGNTLQGIYVECGAFNNVVQGNVIADNGRGGVLLSDVGSDYNVVVGNLIGTDATGTVALGNDWCGIYIGMGSGHNRIGGKKAGEQNVISGNPCGIEVGGVGNVVIGNLIGTDIYGTEAIPNPYGGVSVYGDCNFVGGFLEGERNVISGNGHYGVSLSAFSKDNWVAGNYIGTDASGTEALGNEWCGILIERGAHSNAIQGNLISGNDGDGVSIRANCLFNLLWGNRIGTAADGISPLPNGGAGVRISQASNNIIGGCYSGEGNIIACNAWGGIVVSEGSYNTISGNSIFGHPGRGIVLEKGANGDILPPTLTLATSTAISGIAPPECIVEIFSDSQHEGKVYEGTTSSDSTGAFTFTKPEGLTGPNVTATATDADGNTSEFSAAVPTGVEEDLRYPIPARYALSQNYPNPFNPSTTIRYQLPQASEVKLIVYNLLGQEVRRLVDGKVEAGTHLILWDGRHTSGRALASGMYLYCLQAEAFTQTKRMVILR